MMNDISVLSGDYMVSEFRARGRDFDMLLVSGGGHRLSITSPVAPLMHTPMPTQVRVTFEDASRGDKPKTEAKAADNIQTTDGSRVPWVSRKPSGAIVIERTVSGVLMNWAARELLEDLTKALERPAAGGEQAARPNATPMPEWMLQQARGRSEWRSYNKLRAIVEGAYRDMPGIPLEMSSALEKHADRIRAQYGPKNLCEHHGPLAELATIADEIVAKEGNR